MEPVTSTDRVPIDGGDHGLVHVPDQALEMLDLEGPRLGRPMVLLGQLIEPQSW